MSLLLATRLPFVARLLPALFWLPCIALLALLGADLYWRWAAPTPPPAGYAPDPDPQRNAERIARRGLFGQAQSAPVRTPAASNWQLLGVLTSTPGRPGFALLQSPGEPARALLEGETLPDGTRLVRIAADHVELHGRVGPQRLALASPRTGPPAAPVGLRTPASPGLRSNAPPTRPGINLAPASKPAANPSERGEPRPALPSLRRPPQARPAATDPAPAPTDQPLAARP